MTRFRDPRFQIPLLILLALGSVAAFAATRALAASNARQRTGDALSLHARGRRAIEQGVPAAAVHDLERASILDPDNRDVAVDLAKAYRARGDTSRAITTLESILARHPDDADVNTELARLEADGGQTDLAIRKYQDALDALWSSSDRDRRRALRLEFVRLLLLRQQPARALSQLLVLETEASEQDDQVELGTLFLQADDASRALAHFRAVLAGDPRNQAALGGAGESAFRLGDYQNAVRWLTAADETSAPRADLRRVAQAVLEADPMVPRLSRQAREGRIRAVLQYAQQRLDGCGTPSDQAGAANLRSRIDELAAARVAADRDQDRREQAIDVALDAQGLTAACRLGNPLDRALPLIARAHGLDTRS